MLTATEIDLTGTWPGIVSLIVFFLAYALVATEDLTRMRKSKPVILAAGIIWILVALGSGPEADVEHPVMEHVAEFAAVFLFLMVAMTYVSAISERNVFLRLNAWLLSTGFGLRSVFWATGVLAFLLSPLADNLTTALVMGAVVVTVGAGNDRFISLACINIVVAANAGGAFSPFGDITTLMVWQAQKVGTSQFLELLPAALVDWFVPALIMSRFVPRARGDTQHETIELRDGWWVVILLFVATIATAVMFHALLHLPPFLGMTTGLAYLFMYGYFRRMRRTPVPGEQFDLFKNVAAVEWDTLLFFFGVIMCVGGLQQLGYMAIASRLSYDTLGPFWANVGIGLLSALVDNVPVMFGVLGMNPSMDVGNWLLVTLTAGVGGSMLSIGSAAGVGLMGVAHGHYTFASHLRWAPVIGLGYAASVAVHVLLQQTWFAG